MTSFNAFIFESYGFDKAAGVLELNYRFDNDLSFNEKYTFDFDFEEYDEKLLDRAFQSLFIMAGISYYKAYTVESMELKTLRLDKKMASFFSKTYQKGLGEYFYINKLDPAQKITLPDSTVNITPPSTPLNKGLLIGIGGGKDSLLTVEKLRNEPKVATWSLGHRNQLKPLIEKIGLQHFWVERSIDPLLLELNTKDALNGHVPISAILSCVGVVVAILSGFKDVVVSNENSSNEPTLMYRGVDINHQYSKSIEYEIDFQKYLKHTIGNAVQYYSFLRPYSEVHIAEMFAENGFAIYKNVFSSCNRAFTLQKNSISWCGTCSKCAFTYLAFTPFINRTELIKLWGKDLLKERGLETTYMNLLGISGDKPLDCVGEILESRQAMQLAYKKYDDIPRYSFVIPENYNYRHMATHSMPQEIFDLLP
jgi:hypothetical protein